MDGDIPSITPTSDAFEAILMCPCESTSFELFMDGSIVCAGCSASMVGLEYTPPEGLELLE